MIAVASIITIVDNIYCNSFTEMRDELCNVTHATPSCVCKTLLPSQSTSLLLTVSAFGAFVATATRGVSTCKENNSSSI